MAKKGKQGEGGGQPTKFQEAYNEQVYKLCLLGATDKDLADFFDVDERTINNWKIEHPKFFQSLKKGKQQADIEIADALFNRAKGFVVTTQKAFKVKEHINGQGSKEHVEVVTVDEAYPPDTTAAIFWLKNRQPHLWRDKQEIDHTTNGKSIQHINLGFGEAPDDEENNDVGS